MTIQQEWVSSRIANRLWMARAELSAVRAQLAVLMQERDAVRAALREAIEEIESEWGPSRATHRWRQALGDVA
jgi:hypothetical protein